MPTLLRRTAHALFPMPHPRRIAAPNTADDGFAGGTRWRGLATIVRVLSALVVLQFPAMGYCDSGGGWLGNLFDSKGTSMNEVATKIVTLDEKNEIWGLDFSPDGKHLAATPFDATTVHIWDWPGNRLERILPRANGTNVTVSEPVRYSPDGKLLAICHTNNASEIVGRIWDTDSWNVLQDIVDEPVGGGAVKQSDLPRMATL